MAGPREDLGSSEALAFKHFWLSRPFFLIRAAVYSGIWILFAFAIRQRSRRQDHDGDPRWTHENFRLSAAFLVLFGITVTLASFDWVMSIEYHWFSTIFGVYNFAGLFFSGLAAIILLAIWLERAGPLKGVLNESHLHDLGKLLFAFSVFWVYIWFSQYMLIWYTNIPEETSYFVRRQHGGWFALFLVNLFLNLVIPFVVLLRRDTKRQRRTMAVVAAIVLVGRWLDVYLMIFPGIVGESPTFGLWEIGLTLGGIGGFGLVLAAILEECARGAGRRPRARRKPRVPLVGGHIIKTCGRVSISSISAVSTDGLPSICLRVSRTWICCFSTSIFSIAVGETSTDFPPSQLLVSTTRYATFHVGSTRKSSTWPISPSVACR